MFRNNGRIVEDDKNTIITPQIKSFVKYIEETQKHLRSTIFLSAANTRSRSLVEEFNRLLIKHKIVIKDPNWEDRFVDKILSDQLSKTFESIESINKTFDALLIDMKYEYLGQGIADTHQPLCKGLELVIEWYRIKAIEAFLYKPLANELNKTEVVPESKISLRERFALLNQQILQFNEKLQASESQFEKISLISHNRDGKNFEEKLFPLIREEGSMLAARFAESRKIDEFVQERNMLDVTYRQLYEEQELAIQACKKDMEEQKKHRYALSNTSLIDVYYLREFKDAASYKNAYDAYRTILENKEINSHEKIKWIEETIANLSSRLREFESSLSHYYEETSFLPSVKKTMASFLHIATYGHAVDGMYEFLSEACKSFKDTSQILQLELEYQDAYMLFISHKQNNPAHIRKIIETEFATAAKQFLRDLAGKNTKKLSDEAAAAYEEDLTKNIERLKPRHKVPDLVPVRLVDLRREHLGNSWRAAFQDLFDQDIQTIERVLAHKSNVSLSSLKRLEESLSNKRKELDAILDKNNFDRVSTILSEVYMQVNNHPAVLHLKRCIDMEQKHVASGESAQDAVSAPSSQSNATKPWYTKLWDKPWKVGLLAFVVAVPVLIGVMILVGLPLVAAAVAASLQSIIVSAITYGFAQMECCSKSAVASVKVSENVQQERKPDHKPASKPLNAFYAGYASQPKVETKSTVDYRAATVRERSSESICIPSSSTPAARF